MFLPTILTLLLILVVWFFVFAYKWSKKHHEALNMDVWEVLKRRRNGTFEEYLQERLEYSLNQISWQMKRELEVHLRSKGIPIELVDRITERAARIFETRKNQIAFHYEFIESEKRSVYRFLIHTPFSRKFIASKTEQWKFAHDFLRVIQARNTF